MTFKTILGHIDELLHHANLEFETNTIPSDYLQKKVITAKSNLHNEYGIDLQESPCTLKDGSIFYKSNQKVIVLKVV